MWDGNLRLGQQVVLLVSGKFDPPVAVVIIDRQLLHNLASIVGPEGVIFAKKRPILTFIRGLHIGKFS